MDDLNFDFEQPAQEIDDHSRSLPDSRSFGHARAYGKMYKQTVCSYWLRGLCMKGEACGFLHEYDEERMPLCRNVLRNGSCNEPNCPLRHDLESLKECNMYRLGFCINGPHCKFKHTRQPGPPPKPETVEACKPRLYRNREVLRKWGTNEEPGPTAAQLTGPRGQATGPPGLPGPQPPPGSPPRQAPLQLAQQ